MPKTSSITLGGRFRGLFVGANGTGKTIAAASFPGDVKIFDFDDRIDPVRLFYPKREDIEYITVGAHSTQRSDLIDFKEFCTEFENLQDRCPWDAIVLDSYTSFSATAIMYQMGLNEDVKMSK